ncbi:MAG: hypothetical protein JKX76_03125 [Colwellia sp.]|nr:hypothetical protein [Colwellia sp.]
MQSYLSSGQCELLQQKIPLTNFQYTRKQLRTGVPAIYFTLPNGREIWAGKATIIME